MFDELNRKKKYYEKQAKLGLMVTGIAFLLFIPVMIITRGIGIILIGPAFLGGVIYAGFQGAKFKELSNSFKEKYLKNELEAIIPGSKYVMNDGFSEEEVVDSGLFRKEDRFKSEDLIVGEYKGVHFKSSDVHIIDEYRSDGKTKTRTVFHGRFFKFDFNKKFKTDVFIAQASWLSKLVTYKRVDMESVHFNSELAVYSENPHDAFYLLTPHFMEKLIYLDRKYKDSIQFAFKRNQMYISIASLGDSFELKPNKDVDESIFIEYRNQFKDILEIIDLLKLNNDMFVV